MNNISMMIHKVLIEIPLGNHARVACQIFPHGTGVRSVYIHLLKDGKLGSVLCEGNISNVLCLARLLTSELITGES